MPTIGTFNPYAAEFPATGLAQLTHINRRPALGFDATNMELAYFSFPAPSGISGTISLNVSYAMASATTGGIALGVVVEAISDGDAVDLDSATSFATNNIGTVAAVPGTAGYLDQLLIPLTDNDSLAQADYVRIGIFRVVAHATDTASGDLLFLLGELRSN